MDVSLCSTASHFLLYKCAQNLTLFCVKHVSREIFFSDMPHCRSEKRGIHTIRSIPNHNYTIRESFETLQQQWMSLIVAQYPISCVERVHDIWYFLEWNSRVLLDRNDTLWTIRVLYMILKDHVITIIYLEKGMKRSSSNGYSVLQHSISFPALRGHLVSDILPEIWELFSTEMTQYEQWGPCIWCRKV